MAFYIDWGEEESSVYDRSSFLFEKEYKKLIATKGLCWNCSIFDHAFQKCTHPSLGCEYNKIRTEPWETKLICPKKIKLS